MARPREFDPDSALDAIMNVFWSFGYEKTSFTVLEEKTGIKKASLCSAYGDKDKLFANALERYHQMFCSQMQQICSRNCSPKKILFEWLMERHQDHRGCFIINTITDRPVTTERCRKIIAAHENKMEGLLSEVIGRGKDSGEFRSTLNTTVAVKFLMRIASGTQVLCHLAGKATGDDGKKIYALALKALE